LYSQMKMSSTNKAKVKLFSAHKRCLASPAVRHWPKQPAVPHKPRPTLRRHRSGAAGYVLRRASPRYTALYATPLMQAADMLSIYSYTFKFWQEYTGGQRVLSINSSAKSQSSFVSHRSRMTTWSERLSEYTETPRWQNTVSVLFSLLELQRVPLTAEGISSTKPEQRDTSPILPHGIYKHCSCRTSLLISKIMIKSHKQCARM